MTVPSPKLRQKTDNHALADKCELRRQLIEEARAPDPDTWPKAHAIELEPLHVLDLFAGEGHIWTELRRQPRYDQDLTFEDQPRQLQVEKYTPVDRIQRQPGQLRFKITPRLIAALDENDGLKRYNVIDVDTYGEPWEIWQVLLFHIKQPTAIFLTRGKVTYGAGRMPISKSAKAAMGIPASWDVPGKVELMEHADRCQLLQPCPTARITIGLWTRYPRVDYYALLVEPNGASSDEASSVISD